MDHTFFAARIPQIKVTKTNNGMTVSSTTHRGMEDIFDGRSVEMTLVCSASP
jgi:hypothetical protein